MTVLQSLCKYYSWPSPHLSDEGTSREGFPQNCHLESPLNFHYGPPTTAHQRTHRMVHLKPHHTPSVTGPETRHTASPVRLPTGSGCQPPRPLPLSPDPTRYSPYLHSQSTRSGPRAATREAEQAPRQRPRRWQRRPQLLPPLVPPPRPRTLAPHARRDRSAANK